MAWTFSVPEPILAEERSFLPSFIFETDVRPRQASFSLLDVIQYCLHLEKIWISGYNEANLRIISVGDHDALAFPCITYANLQSIYRDSTLSCSRLLGGLFPRVQQLQLRYPQFLVGSFDSTTVFGYSAARYLSTIEVDIDFLFGNGGRDRTIQIELTAIDKIATYDLNLCQRHQKPVSITRRTGANSNLEQPTVVFKFFWYLTSLSLIYSHKQVVLRMEPRFNDIYYFYSY